MCFVFITFKFVIKQIYSYKISKNSLQQQMKSCDSYLNKAESLGILLEIIIFFAKV